MNGSVQAAFDAVPRSAFLPPLQRGFARLNRPLPLGHGQTNSQPSTVRDMLELLDVEVGQRVLDVGSGSGWTTALLAHLVGPGGSVLGLERVPALVDSGRENLHHLGLPQARIEAADPRQLGAPTGAPYDRILVSAEASRLPEELVGQLAPDGIMVVPVAGRMTRVRRTGREPADREVTRHGHYAFVPLVEP